MRLQAEKLANIAPNLSIKANKLANTVWEGIHNRNKTGIGENFWQFKKYEHGDPIHLIDWKKSAKSQDFYIQEQELSTIQNINIWRDTSNSMNYSSSKNIESKINIANLITLTLSIILVKNMEKVKLNSIGLKYNNDNKAIELITNQLITKTSKKYQSHPNSEEIINGSTSILIGDFLYNPKNTENIIKTLSSRNINGLLIHIVDPAEKLFPYSGRINFKGTEGEEPHLVGNADTIKKQYLDKFNKHCNKLKNLSESYGWNYFMHITNQDLVELIIKIYSNLSSNNQENIEI